MKPGDFYVGVLEFFAILLPGSILLGYLVVQPYFQPALGLFPLSGEVERYAGFLMAAYALGHMIFLAASYVDALYNPVRRLVWPDTDGDAFALATALRRRHVPDSPGTPAELRPRWLAHLLRLLRIARSPDRPMNTFKWSTAYLVQNKPAAAAEVRRHEADSKFFRSLVVLLAMLCVLLGSEGDAVLAAASGALGLACFARYAEQRHKSTETAYRHVIVLCTPNPFRTRQKPEQAGG